MRRWLFPVTVGMALLACGVLPARAEEKVLRVSLATELQILDPIVTTINATRNFTYLVYDMLVGLDSQGNYRPQMLRDWAVSEDRLVWTFHLRDGLEWSDGSPVTAEDCVASIRRWAKRDGLGLLMMQASESLLATDAETFVLRLNRPFSFVVESLGRPGNQIPAMMPKRLADLTADQAVPETIGSGPFIFDRANWRPGERAVFLRNARYKPRDEPADWLAGGKVVKVDRVELLSLPDAATRVAALQRGEIDYIENLPPDFVEAIARDRNVIMSNPKGAEQIMLILTLNHAQKPFDNVLVRRAAQVALNQEETMESLGLPEGMFLKRCESIYMCGSPAESAAGTGVFTAAGPEAARALLKEAGYNGEPVVLLHAASSTLLNNTGLDVADQLKRAGFNVDVRTSDYATVARRRLSREPVENGGWSVIPVVWNGIDLINPLANTGLAYNCVSNYPGWVCDPRQTGLLRQLSEAGSPAEKRGLADELQASFHQNVNFIIGGQFSVPLAWRAELQGVVPFPIPIFWNISKR
jgi:peptide/nickel transport system substrate-binding protein